MENTIKVRAASNLEELWENFLEGTKQYLKISLGKNCSSVKINYPFSRPKGVVKPSQHEDHIVLYSSKSITDKFKIIIRFDRTKRKKESSGGIYFSFNVQERQKYKRISKIEFNVSILEEDVLLKQFESFLSTGSVIDEYYFLDHPSILHLHEAATM